MFVAVQVSSMKTSRSGSRSGWLANQSWRFFRTSGRSCSTACPVFFCASGHGVGRTARARRSTRRLRARPGGHGVPRGSDPAPPPAPPSPPRAPPRSVETACRHPVASGRSRLSPAASRPTGSRKKPKRRSGPPPRDGSCRHPPPQASVLSNPWKVACPSRHPDIRLGYTESDFGDLGNPPQRFILIGQRSNGSLELQV